MPKSYTVDDDYHDSRIDKWFKNEIINLMIGPSYKESLQEKAKQEKMSLAKYCSEKLTRDIVT